MLTLILKQGEEDEALTLRLEQDLVTLGRSKENTVVIVNRKASRKHAKIERVGATYQLTDLDSGNGTRLNGKKIDFEAINVGDTIGIGDATLVVKSMDEGPDRVELDDSEDLLPEPKPVPADDRPTEITAPVRPSSKK